MGLFFEQRTPNPELVGMMAEALRTTPPAGTSQQRAVELAGNLHPLVQSLTTALDSPVPANPAAATVAAQAAVNQLLGGSSFNSGRFWIALAIFLGLVGGGIATEATHLTTATGTLFGFAGAIFGIVTAFLGTEKASG
jgi:hypothetical protein